MNQSLHSRGTAFAALRWCVPLACLWLQACDSGALTTISVSIALSAACASHGNTASSTAPSNFIDDSRFSLSRN